jgi:hypothetical protein
MKSNSTPISNFPAAFERLLPQSVCAAIFAEHGPRGGGAPKLSAWGWMMSRVYHEFARIGSFSASVLEVTRVSISDSALSQRAMSIGVGAVAEVLPAVLRPLAEPGAHPDAFYGGFRLAAIDGVRFNLRNTPATAARATKTRCSKGGGEPAFAQLLATVLVELGTHQPLAVALGWKRESELALARDLLGGFRFADRSLLFADRLYGAPTLLWDIMTMLEETGSAVLFRVKGNLKARVKEHLPDGSQLVSVDVIGRGGRKKIGVLSLREIVAEVHYEGAAEPEKVRLWTTLLDAAAHPATELVELYAGRWEEELFFRELKSHLHGRDNLLDAQTPETAAQEVLAMLLAAAIVAEQRVAVAGFAGVGLLQVSFAKVYHKTATITEFVALAGDLVTPEVVAKICERALEDLAVTALIKKRKGRSCPRSVRQPTKDWPKTRTPSSKIVEKTIIIPNPNP